MQSEIQLIWQEISSDLSSRVVLWQLFVIILSVLLAWAVNGALKKYIYQTALESIKPAIGSINRILFPISALVILMLAKWMLKDWMHISLLQLASKLFLAMAIVRLLVYALRYIFNPSGWLKTLEHFIVWSIWGLFALHLSGLLHTIAEGLESVEFSVGKNKLNLMVLGQGMLTVIVTILIALWVSRLIENKLMRAEQVSINMRVIIAKLIRIVFLMVAILVALSAAGLDITLLSVFGGALGVGLGLGLQKIASNYVSGFILLLDKSMKIGDKITVDKHQGIISDMRTRYMLLDKQDGTHVIIPNEILITTTVVNHSLVGNQSRVEIQVYIQQNSPLDEVIGLMQEIAKKKTGISVLPAPEVLVKGFTENGIELLLRVWINDFAKTQSSVQSELYTDLWQAFKQHQIAFAKNAVS